MTKEERKRQQAQQLRARVLYELDKSAGVFAKWEDNTRFQPAGTFGITRGFAVGFSPVRFSKEFVAEL